MFVSVKKNTISYMTKKTNSDFCLKFLSRWDPYERKNCASNLRMDKTLAGILSTKEKYDTLYDTNP